MFVIEDRKIKVTNQNKQIISYNEPYLGNIIDNFYPTNN
jgi:hypothetical protein